jgi:hypothetical protein
VSNHDNALENALRAAAQGYAVAPTTINKTPAIPSPHEKGHSCKGDCGQPGHGVYDATTNAADVRRLFGLAPKAVGYLIACRGRLVGLDIDVKNGVNGYETLAELGRKHGFEIPRITTTVFTPSGGAHVWLTVSEGVTVPNSVGRLGLGLDVRGTGGYLVGPGSIGRAGEYTFHPKIGYVEPQPVPDALLQLMLPPAPVRPRRQYEPRGEQVDRALEGLARVVLGATNGERNSKLYWAASKAWAHVADGHLAAGDVEAELIGAALQIGLGEAEARRTIASAGRGARA